MTKLTYQTAALHALKELAINGRNDNTPLRTQIEHAIDIDYDDLADLGEFDQAIDYAMRYLARATRQVPDAFVPSITSVADLTKLDRTYTIVPICRQAIEFMAAEMPPSTLDCQLAQQALRSIAQTITATIEDTTDSLAALIREELQRAAYRDADHLYCVSNAICAGLTHATDRKISLEDSPRDLAPLTSLPSLFDRAAATIMT